MTATAAQLAAAAATFAATPAAQMVIADMGTAYNLAQRDGRCCLLGSPIWAGQTRIRTVRVLTRDGRTIAGTAANPSLSALDFRGIGEAMISGWTIAQPGSADAWPSIPAGQTLRVLQESGKAAEFTRTAAGWTTRSGYSERKLSPAQFSAQIARARVAAFQIAA